MKAKVKKAGGTNFPITSKLYQNHEKKKEKDYVSQHSVKNYLKIKKINYKLKNQWVSEN